MAGHCIVGKNKMLQSMLIISGLGLVESVAMQPNRGTLSPGADAASDEERKLILAVLSQPDLVAAVSSSLKVTPDRIEAALRGSGSGENIPEELAAKFGEQTIREYLADLLSKCAGDTGDQIPPSHVMEIFARGDAAADAVKKVHEDREYGRLTDQWQLRM